MDELFEGGHLHWTAQKIIGAGLVDLWVVTDG